MKATEGHSDYNRWPEIVWGCMQDISGTKYTDPTFEEENDEEEVDDTQLKEATIQNAQLRLRIKYSCPK